MDWTNIITCIITTLLGGGIGVLATLKTRMKRDEFELLKEELMLERERNKELIEDRTRMRNQYDDMRDKLDAKLDDKTVRLRESQDRECETRHELNLAQKENTRLTKENGDLRLELEQVRCLDFPCMTRRPPNEHTRKAIAESKNNNSKKG